MFDTLNIYWIFLEGSKIYLTQSDESKTGSGFRAGGGNGHKVGLDFIAFLSTKVQFSL